MVEFRSGVRRITVAEDAMQILRERMYDYHIDDLVRATGCSKACLYAIRANRTAWPRPHTFFRLLDVLGLEMILRVRGGR